MIVIIVGSDEEIVGKKKGVPKKWHQFINIMAPFFHFQG